MSREEIIAMAREAGAGFACDTLLLNGKDADDFICRFAASPLWWRPRSVGPVLTLSQSRHLRHGGGMPPNHQRAFYRHPRKGAA